MIDTPQLRFRCASFWRMALCVWILAATTTYPNDSQIQDALSAPDAENTALDSKSTMPGSTVLDSKSTVSSSAQEASTAATKSVLQNPATGQPRKPQPFPLLPAELLRSVELHFPLIVAAKLERNVAAGELMKSRGRFDTRLDLYAKSEPRGFYETDQVNLSVNQPLVALGAEIESGYRLGRGDFAVYDGKQKTNRDGEFRVGVSVPLLKDRAIDDRRAELRIAQIGVESATPLVVRQRIETTRQAMLAYWEWVAAGEKNRIARGVLNLATERQENLSEAVAEGLLAEIVLVDNERLIAERRGKQLETDRKLQETAIKLSLFLRDGGGQPVIPSETRVPKNFPELSAPQIDLPTDIERALNNRPDLRQLELERESKSVEIRRSRNKLLPDMDFNAQLSKDYGEQANVPDDKRELEVQVGLKFQLPLQRRSARGELRKLEAEQARLDQKIRFAKDKITAAVQDTYSEWVMAFQRFEQAARSAELARELEQAERFQLQEGNSDLLRLNLREQQTAQAAEFVVDVASEYFEARNNYLAAIGATPSS